jgi:hypothetical protein
MKIKGRKTVLVVKILRLHTHTHTHTHEVTHSFTVNILNFSFALSNACRRAQATSMEKHLSPCRTVNTHCLHCKAQSVNAVCCEYHSKHVPTLCGQNAVSQCYSRWFVYLLLGSQAVHLPSLKLVHMFMRTSLLILFIGLSPGYGVF